MERGYDAGGYKIDPDARTSFLVGVGRKEGFGGRVGVFEELADDGAFIERFVIVFEGRDETSGVEFEEGFRLVVGVYPGFVNEGRCEVGIVTDLYVLERDLLFEEDEENSLNEWAELGCSAIEEMIVIE